MGVGLFEKIKKLRFVENYRKMWVYVKPYKMRALAAVIVTLPMGAMDAAIAMLLKPYIDAVMVDKNSAANSIMPLVVIGVSLLQSILNYYSTYLNAWVGQKITLDLKAKLFDKLLGNEVAFFDTRTSGDVQMRYNNDADAASNGLIGNLKSVVTQIFSSIALLGVLIWNSWQLSIVAIIAMGVAMYPVSQLRSKVKGLVKEQVATGANVSTYYNETYAANRIVTSYNLYEYQQRRFENKLKEIFGLGMKMTRRTGILSPLMHFIVSLGIAGVVWLGGYLIVTDRLSPGGFVSFISALLMLYTPVKALGNNFTSLQMSFMAMERVFEVLERPTVLGNSSDAKVLNGVRESIVYKDVVFEYIEGNPVLKGVNLTINKGDTLALVGNSGGGKTTFVNLLPRFYDVTSGSITIDGVDVRNIDLTSLRDNIAVVFQDNVLFAGTIRENIMLGRANCTDEQLQSAISSACLDEFIYSEACPQGLDTQIGERGVLLSGGQKQRIAIARAFLKDAPIVILDEATSALDNKSESIVQQAIYNLMQERTVFIIAHRLSTIRHANKLVVVNYGEIVEVGTHDELVNQPNSIYAGLYKSQMR